MGRQCPPPPLNSSELQAICDTIAAVPNNYYTKNEVITAQTLQKLTLSGDKLPNDAFSKLTDWCLDIYNKFNYNCKIWNTQYVGNGGLSVSVSGIPFTPKAMMVSIYNASGASWNNELQPTFFLFAAGNSNGGVVSVSFGANSVVISATNPSAASRLIPNVNSWIYYLAAFG